MESRRVLIAYITRAGYTRIVATTIAQRLREAGFETEIADLELCIRRPERYDAIVLACAAHHHRHSQTLAEWIEDNHDALAARVTALVSIEHGDHSARLFSHTHWRPQHLLVLDAIDEPALRRFVRELRAEKPQPHPSLGIPKIVAFADSLVPVIRSAAPRSDRGVLPFAPGRTRRPSPPAR